VCYQNSIGFWQWCITISSTTLLVFWASPIIQYSKTEHDILGV
jgi:hypothetical protein